jgi:hypothetical protein
VISSNSQIVLANNTIKIMGIFMTKTVETLSAQWVECKRLEAEANQRRLEIEKEICELAKNNMPAQGTVKLGGLKITTGFDRKWDTEVLTDIYRTRPPVFPFKVSWKEDRRTTSKLEIEQAEVMSMFMPALTIKEKKPSFTIAE